MPERPAPSTGGLVLLRSELRAWNVEVSPRGGRSRRGKYATRGTLPVAVSDAKPSGIPTPRIVAELRSQKDGAAVRYGLSSENFTEAAPSPAPVPAATRCHPNSAQSCGSGSRSRRGSSSFGSVALPGPLRPFCLGIPADPSLVTPVAARVAARRLLVRGTDRGPFGPFALLCFAIPPL